MIGSEKIWERGAALPSRLHWFETEVLRQDENLKGLSRINRELLAKAQAVDARRRVVLDMDSTEIPVYGEQQQSACQPGCHRGRVHSVQQRSDRTDGKFDRLVRGPLLIDHRLCGHHSGERPIVVARANGGSPPHRVEVFSNRDRSLSIATAYFAYWGVIGLQTWA